MIFRPVPAFGAEHRRTPPLPADCSPALLPPAARARPCAALFRPTRCVRSFPTHCTRPGKGGIRMKVSLHPVVVVCSAALAACCLLAGRGRLPASSTRHPPAGTVLHCAGQALTILRQKARRTAHRAMQALLACLTVPLAAWMAAAKTASPALRLILPGQAAPARALLPAAAADPDAASAPAAPPGNAAHPARASPPPGCPPRPHPICFLPASALSGKPAAPRAVFPHAVPPLSY